MSILDDFRKKYPTYAKVPDDKLADGIYRKFYAGKMPREQFDQRLGLQPVTPEHGAMTRGFVSQLVSGNPQAMAETLEGFSHLAGDPTYARNFREMSEGLRGAAKQPAGYEPKTRGLEDIEGVGSALTYAGERAGEAVASTVPSLVTGGLGGFLGSRVAGRYGAAAGAIGGAAMSAYPLNYGDLYQALKEEGVSPKVAAEWALGGAIPITALDVATPAGMISRLTGGVRKEAYRGIAKRIVQEGLKNAGIESGTEAAQQAIQEGLVNQATGKPWSWQDVKQITEAGISGGLGGGLLGGASGVVPDRKGAADAISKVQQVREDQRPGAEAEILQSVPRRLPAGTSSEVPAGATPAEEIIGATPGGVETAKEGRTEAPAPGAPSVRPEAPSQQAPAAQPQARRFADLLHEHRRQPEARQINGYLKQLLREKARLDQNNLGGRFNQQVANLNTRIVEVEREGVPLLEDVRRREILRQHNIGGRYNEQIGVLDRRIVDVRKRINFKGALADPAAEPTPAQAEAGNYRKRHFAWQGLDIAIETEKGGIRRSKPGASRQWEVKMPAAYGYVKGTEGRDGDQVDIYLGEQPEAPHVFVIDQVKPDTRRFDEHKAMIGFPDDQSAMAAYDAAFADGSGPRRVGAVAKLTVPEFKDWLARGNTKKPLRYAEPAKVKNPESLLSFIVRKGGMKDEDGELEAMDARLRRPGIINKRTGYSYDAMREMAQEAGYLPRDEDPNRPSQSTVNRLLRAIGDELGGKRQIAEEDVDAELDFQAARQQEREQDLAERDVENAVADMGHIGVTKEEIAEATELVLNGAPPELALEHIMIRSGLEIQDKEEQNAIDEESFPAAAGPAAGGTPGPGEGLPPVREPAEERPDAGRPAEAPQERDEPGAPGGGQGQETRAPESPPGPSDQAVTPEPAAPEPAPPAEEPAAAAAREPAQEGAFQADDKTKRLIAVAETIAAELGKARQMTMPVLQSLADAVMGGKMAEGRYDRKDLYDAIELGFNLTMAPGTPNAGNANVPTARNHARWIRNRLKDLPTQTVRSQEQVQFQQFSTPPDYGFAVAWLANIGEDDRVLEPSAGTGNIAVHAINAEPQAVYLNELAPRRAAMLRALDRKGRVSERMQFRVFTEDAEQINNILPAEVKPTVVVMNPPFSQTAGRMGNQRDLMVAARHIEQALKRLEPGGRLVAIVGGGTDNQVRKSEGMSLTSPTYQDWWKKIAESYHIRANVLVDGKVYAKNGTNFRTRVLVIDKTGATAGRLTVTEPTPGKPIENIPDLIDILSEVRNARQPAPQPTAQQPSGEPGGAGAASQGGRGPRPGGQPVRPEPGALGPGTGTAGTGTRPGGEREPGTAGRPAAGPGPGEGASVAAPGPGTGGQPAPGDRGSGEPAAGVPGRDGSPAQPPVGEPAGPAESGEPAGLRTEEATPQEQQRPLTESVYEPYQPQRLSIPGSKPHPGPLVESAAMQSVRPPAVTYSPKLPQKLVENGELSLPQLEAITYAGQAHSEMLPAAEGETARRRGFFVGDGTGVGKGREAAGIILDNWKQGRTKAVWVSEKPTLVKDARRDWKGLRQDPNLIFEMKKVKASGQIAAKQGIAFITYDTLKSGMSDQKKVALAKGANGKIDPELAKRAAKGTRVDQLVRWLGKDFDGVIIFDEAHNMGNAVASRGSRGVKDAAMKALAGVEFQQKLPNARIVYSSATGATEVSNLAYAERLGLWGRGTPFSSLAKFLGEIGSGGIAAMELVARDLKAMGSYLARNLSYEGVEYERLDHVLSPQQREIYDELAGAWQVVLRNVDQALDLTNQKLNSRAKSAALSAFWGAHQRFFNQIITSMQMPSVLEAIKTDVAEGRQAVLQLVNTNEASTERAVERAQEADEDIEDLDLTPRDQLIEYLRKSFPTAQFEEYVDDNGNRRSRRVEDAAGRPVENKEMVNLRDELIARLASIRVPDGPLDYILNQFGADTVAEVTGRKRRFIMARDPKTGQMRRVEQNRPASANIAEADAFQDGKKKILVFSEAGGTGRSYHADNTALSKNARRVHYLVQAGWRADKAVQGFGRSHRTNQASAPIFRLVTTDLKGQKRFISSIARRLAQLGALTKGQRQAGDQGAFTARDNLENQEARDALRVFFQRLFDGKVPGITLRNFEQQTGLRLTEVDRGGQPRLRADLPPIEQFLNRLLSMRIDDQNRAFDYFDMVLDQLVEQRTRDGTLDTGLKTYRADKIEKNSEKVAYTDPKTGAETKYVHLTASHRVHPRTFKTVVSGKTKPLFFVENPSAAKHKLFAVFPGGQTTDSKGNVVDSYRLTGPMRSDWEDRPKLDDLIRQGKRRKLTPEQAQKRWFEEVAKIPEFETEDLHLITGAVLPIWDRLGGYPSVLRLQTDAGERLLGRQLNEADVQPTLERLGVTADKVQLTPQQIVDRILDGGDAELANGWRILRRTVAGDPRIEIIGPSDWAEGQALKKDGVFSEMIDYRTRYFIPVGDDAAKVLGRVIEFRPVVKVTGGTGRPAGLAQPQSSGIGVFHDERDDWNAFLAGQQPSGAQARDFVLDRGRAANREFIVAIDADGAVIGVGRGDESTAGFSAAMTEAVLDGDREVVMHHNHPNGLPLSKEDIAILTMPGLSAVWAHGHNGTAYRAALTEAGRKAFGIKAGKTTLGAVQTRYGVVMFRLVNVSAAIRSKLQPAVFAKMLTVEDAERADGLIFSLALARAGLIDFTTTDDLAFLDKADHFQKALTAATEVARSWLENVIGATDAKAATLGWPYRPAEPLRHAGEVGTIPGGGLGLAEERPGGQTGGYRSREDGRPEAERTAQGDQLVIPGAERISDRALIERRSGDKLSGKKAQKSAFDAGLGDLESERKAMAAPAGWERVETARPGAETKLLLPDVSATVDPATKRKREAVKRQIVDMVVKMSGNRKTRVEIADLLSVDIPGGGFKPVGGLHNNMANLIGIALEQPRPLEWAGRHEIIHLIRDMGILTRAEWLTLVDHVVKHGLMARYDIPARYKHLDRKAQIEETIAETFGEGRGEQWKKLPGPVRRILIKIDQLLMRIAALVRRVFGKQATAADIFSGIESGYYARRARITDRELVFLRGNRPVVRVGGWLLSRRGSDGEPLVAGAVELKDDPSSSGGGGKAKAMAGPVPDFSKLQLGRAATIIAARLGAKKHGQGHTYPHLSGDRLARSRYYTLQDGRELRISDHGSGVDSAHINVYLRLDDGYAEITVRNTNELYGAGLGETIILERGRKDQVGPEIDLYGDPIPDWLRFGGDGAAWSAAVLDALKENAARNVVRSEGLENRTQPSRQEQLIQGGKETRPQTERDPQGERSDTETMAAGRRPQGAPPSWRGSTAATAPARQQNMQSWLSKGQPIDRALRMPFDWFGGVDQQGRWRPGVRLTKGAGRIIGTAKFAPDGRMAWLNPVLETARAGLIDRYGLADQYITRDRQRALDERRIMLQGAEILTTLKDHAVGAEEARVLQAILTGEAVNNEDMGRLAAPIRQAIDDLGAEAVSLGLVSPESFERNRGTYLHRVYLKHEEDATRLARWVGSFMGRKRKKIIGDQLKGRGLFLELDMPRAMRDVPGFREGTTGPAVKGQRMLVLDRLPEQDEMQLDETPVRERRPVDRVFWSADQPIPPRFADYTDRGEWEVRDVRGRKVTLWRDYTKAERQQMGEILDARYTIAKTFMLMGHDLATGRFYKDIAENEEWTRSEQPAGRWAHAADLPWWSRTFTQYEWIKVPDVDIPDTGGKKRWGALSGKWVRAEIWRDINELHILNRPNLWRQLLTQWKLNKTARSPVVHMNNVISNLVLMDMADVRWQDLYSSIRSYAAGDADYQDAVNHGVFGVDMMSAEIRKTVLEPVLRELRQQPLGGEAELLNRFGSLGKFTEKLWAGVKRIDGKMVDLYRIEDDVLRMAAYMRHKQSGLSPEDAAAAAREEFIDYDIRAPWVNAARNTVLPFISYTYRAAPLVARMVATRPWKLAKYALIGYMANALAYMMSPGDEDDERRSMDERERVHTWIGVERMMRMPWRDRYGNPVFLDIRRWIPAGDVFDIGQGSGAFPIPAPLNFGGPLALAAELLLNKSAFTGEEITNELTDTWWDKTGKVADYVYKAWVPSAAWVPGSWYWNKIAGAIGGETDFKGRPLQLEYVLPSAFGVKLKPQDVESGFYFQKAKIRDTINALGDQMRDLRKSLNRKRISQATFDSRMEDLRGRIEELKARAATLNPKRPTTEAAAP